MIGDHEEAKVQPASSRIALMMLYSCRCCVTVSGVRQRTNVKALKAASLLIGATLLCAGAPASGLEGVWRNSLNTVHLRVAACGDAMCATVVWATEKARADARKGSGQDLVGSRLLSGLRPAGTGKWRGKAYVPDIDRHATATVTRTKPDQLRVSGCVLVFCQTRHWQRIG